jgi:hypothetical protein
MHWNSSNSNKIDNDKDIMMTPPENTLNYPAPDLAVMNASRTVVNNQIGSLKLTFLPAMKEKLLPLQRALTKADNVFRQQLGTVIVRLKAAQLDEISAKRKQAEEETRLSEEQRRQVLDILDQQYSAVVADLSMTIHDSALAIAQGTDDLVQIDVELKDDQVRNSLQRQIDQFGHRFTELQTRMTTIADDRSLLDATIKTFEQFNVLDIFKEALPTIDELKAMSLPAPELALAEAGLARLQKLIGNVSRALTYLDLVNERDKLRAQYNEALDESRRIEAENRQVAQDLSEVDGLASLARSKRDWADQAKKAPQALSAFRSDYMSQAAPPVSSDLLKQLVGYITSFYSIEREI